MKKTTFLLIFLVISSCVIGQVKLWNKELKKIKTKGTFLTIEEQSVVPENSTEKIFGLIPAATVAGTLLPFAFQYGYTALKSITSKKETDYNSENISFNNLTLDFKRLKKGKVNISTILNYYPKGKSDSEIASKYSLSIEKVNNSLVVSLADVSKENYVPVKSKRKYDFIIQTIDVTVQAEIITKISEKVNKVELSKLGAAKITRTIASFTNGEQKILNKGMVLLPKYNSAGKEVEIKNLILSCKVTYLNPYGLTQSSLNKFLEDNSDTNESLFNTIFVEPKE